MKRYNPFHQFFSIIALCSVLFFVVGCNDQPAPGPMSPVNSNKPLISAQNPNSTDAVRPLTRIDRAAGNSLAKLVSYNVKAVLHAQDLIDELQYVATYNGTSNTRTKAANAVSKIVAAQNELNKTSPNKSFAFSKLNEAMSALSGIMSDNSLNSTTVNQFINEINALLDIINIGGTINHDCRGLTKYLWMKKSDGGLLAFCGHKIVFPKNALKNDGNMFIKISNTNYITIDCGPDGTFNSLVNVYISYRDADMTGVNVNNLTTAWYDTATGQWINLGGTVDSNAKVVNVLTNHFTQYTISTK